MVFLPSVNRAGFSISLLGRDHPAYPAARGVNVATVTRDEVKVDVVNGLPGGRADVNADVIAIGLVYLIDQGARGA
jgi:hypothetical protein